MQAGDAPRSLLLVDDSRDYCTLVERAFRLAKSGTAVFPMGDGQSAIEHLVLCGSQRPVPDLVLLDRVMPGGPDGYDVLRAIRSLKALSALPVLMISGSDDEEHVAQARDAGADGYLVKPCSKDDYPQLARGVLDWWARQESWRRSGGAATGQELATVERTLQSSQKTTMSASVISDAHPVQIPGDANAFRALYDHMRGIIQQTFDPVMVAIHEACRRHRIPPGHAMGRGQDHVTLANRQAVIFDLFDLGYSDRVIHENFAISERQIERLRAAWRAKRGGVVAVREI